MKKNLQPWFFTPEIYQEHNSRRHRFDYSARHVLGGKGFVCPSDRLTLPPLAQVEKEKSDIANFFKSGKADISFSM